MLKQQWTVRLTLTEDQKKAVQQATGKHADALELSVEELEERIAPSRLIRKLQT